MVFLAYEKTKCVNSYIFSQQQQTRNWLTDYNNTCKNWQWPCFFFGINKDTAYPEALGYSTEDTGNGLDEGVLRCAVLFLL